MVRLFGRGVSGLRLFGRVGHFAEAFDHFAQFGNLAPQGGDIFRLASPIRGSAGPSHPSGTGRALEVGWPIRTARLRRRARLRGKARLGRSTKIRGAAELRWSARLRGGRPLGGTVRAWRALIVEGFAEALGETFEVLGGVGQSGLAEEADGLFDVVEFALEVFAGRPVGSTVGVAWPDVRPVGAFEPLPLSVALGALDAFGPLALLLLSGFLVGLVCFLVFGHGGFDLFADLGSERGGLLQFARFLERLGFFHRLAHFFAQVPGELVLVAVRLRPALIRGAGAGVFFVSGRWRSLRWRRGILGESGNDQGGGAARKEGEETWLHGLGGRLLNRQSIPAEVNVH